MEITRQIARQASYDIKHYKEGIGRKKVRDKFIYFYISNNKLVTKKDQDRINKLRIPPAWNNVWVSPKEASPIQAVGIDSKGRKQYKYHNRHIEEAEKKKFAKLFDFIQSIPKLDKVINKHDKLGVYNKNRVITTMLKIIKELHLRVGKECYARTNKSYGVSSLKKIHVKLDRGKIFFRFKAKANKRVSYSLIDPAMAKHIRALLKLEGDKLFQYIDEKDYIRRVTDTDLNKYIQKYMGPNYTCKDFRTYAGNYYFTMALLRETRSRLPKNKKIIKKNIIRALDTTKKYLRNTRAISKKSYVMNFFIEMYQKTPEYFIKRKNDDPNEVLLDLLSMYRKKVLKI